MKLRPLEQEQAATIARVRHGCRKGESAYVASILFHIILDAAAETDNMEVHEHDRSTFEPTRGSVLGKKTWRRRSGKDQVWESLLRGIGSDVDDGIIWIW